MVRGGGKGYLMHLVFLGQGGMGVPFIGAVPPMGREMQPGWYGSVATVLQPDGRDGPTLLIDAGAAIANQWATWAEAPRQPDVLILTHTHFDHMGGIGFLKYCDPPLDVYATAETLGRMGLFARAVWPEAHLFGFVPHLLPTAGQAMICGVEIETVPLHHTPQMGDTGLLIRHRGRFLAHLSDTNPEIAPGVRAAVRGCDALIVNTPFWEDTAYHLGIPASLTLAREVGARRLVLTHLSYEVDADALAALTAMHDWVTVAHDGMALDI